MGRPAVFLDRDGTINVDKDYLFRIEECEYLDGAIEGLRYLEDKGFVLIIITNQSGIARGYYTEKDYENFMDWMLSDLADKGVHIAKAYYCPHLRGSLIRDYDIDCDCRKPATGLFYQAQKEFDIDMDRSIAIGDKVRDLAICGESNVHGILLGKERQEAVFEYDLSDGWKQIIELMENRL